ncbi:MAG: hypothetical protein JEZ11_08780 [Desulfobacterales bacterium]|nr:hypothetical protein [Desulfobacterales bacterium]
MKQCLLAVIWMMVGIAPVWAHGVHYDFESEKTVCLRVSYSDGEPMSYAKAKIFSPADAEIEHQNGRTDKNGRFAFVPDIEGAWRIDVEDGMGHAVKAEIRIEDTGDHVKETSPPAAGGASAVNAMAGLSGIFFLFGLFFWWKGLRRSPVKSDLI